MRVAVGTDEVTAVTGAIAARLADAGHEVIPAGAGDPWPDVGHAVGRAVAEGRADVGIACCWTGTGVSIAANKVPGVRAALCADAETARGARRWNDANVLALGLRLTTDALAAEIVAAFLATGPDEGEETTIATVEPANGPE